jgi:hypothetical protein
MFGPLKAAMGGKKFRSDEEVQQAVHGGPVLNEMETM